MTIDEKLESLQNQINSIRGDVDDMTYARVWSDTCRDIGWIQDLPGISPGRWAVGYNYIYVMTRILNEFQPHRVLELGLGISTTLISTYFRHLIADDCEHIAIEQNAEWKKFYLNGHTIPSCSHIYIAPVVTCEKDGQQFEMYRDLHPFIDGKQFSLISIDGPRGGDYYSRRDLLPYLPQILTQDFIIVLDDAQRPGEQRTMADILLILKNAGIAYKFGFYAGSKYTAVIASKNLDYFCTL